MLVLTRKPGQKIMVGADIVITVLEDKGEAGIRIGIEAPRHVAIKREEIHAAVSDANVSAASATVDDLLAGLANAAGARSPSRRTSAIRQAAAMELRDTAVPETEY